MPDEIIEKQDYAAMSDEELDRAVAELEAESQKTEEVIDEEEITPLSPPLQKGDKEEEEEEEGEKIIQQEDETPLIKKLRGTIKGYERKARDLERELHYLKQQRMEKPVEDNGEKPISREELLRAYEEDPTQFIEKLIKHATESAIQRIEKTNQSAKFRESVEYNEKIRDSFEEKHPELTSEDMEEIAQFAVKRFMPDRYGRYDDNVLEDALLLLKREDVFKSKSRESKIKLLEALEKGKPRAKVVSPGGRISERGIDIQKLRGMGQDEAKAYIQKLNISDEQLDELLSKL